MSITDLEIDRGLSKEGDPLDDDSALDTEQSVLIKASRRSLGINIGELWEAHELLFFLAWRDVKVRYKQTLLGAAWAVLQPLLMMVVFTIFFGRLGGVSHGNLPYPIFALAGLLPWTLFASSVTNASGSVIGSERLITKIYFPRLAIPLASIGTALVDFCVGLALLVALMAYYRIAPGPGLFLAPVIALLIVLASVGMGVLLAAFNVAYRDFRYVIPFLLQLGLFATPTIFMQADSSASGPYRWVFALNPMITLVSAFRASVLGGPIAWTSLGGAGAVVVLASVVGCLYFRRMEDGFSDII